MHGHSATGVLAYIRDSSMLMGQQRYDMAAPTARIEVSTPCDQAPSSMVHLCSRSHPWTLAWILQLKLLPSACSVSMLPLLPPG